MALASAMPRRLRETVYRYSSSHEAMQPEDLGSVSAETVARWVASEYPERSYPAKGTFRWAWRSATLS